jgi:PST family polysaccharide transporter
MKKKLKKNSFVEGAFIAYISIVITKIIGALYNIPLYNIIGEEGGFIYSCAYNVYSLFLEISTSGIPIAMSIIICEYNALNKYRSKERAYKLGIYCILILSILSFLFIQLYAGNMANYFVNNSTDGANIKDVATSFRVISYCLLIVPFLSVERGYLQGHKLISLSSYSQVIEQFVRIAFVLISSYVIIKYYHLSQNFGVLFALAGAGIGALAATIYLKKRKKNNLDLFLKESADETIENDRTILKKMANYSSVVIITSISLSIYKIMHMRLILVGLDNLGYLANDAQLISSIISHWAPKICMLIIALSMGMTGSIAPHIADNYANKDYQGVKNKIHQALSILFIITVPLTIAMVIFSGSLYNIFYGSSIYGDKILAMSLILNAVGTFSTIFSTIMQSMGKGKIVCFANVTGNILNVVFDLPLIYLFAYLNLPPYLGALASSILSQIFITFVLAYDLKKHINFKYNKLYKTIQQMIIPLFAMLMFIFVLNRFWTVDGNGRIYQAFQLMIYGITGSIIYFSLSYKSGLLENIADAGFFKKIISSLKPEK